jgi:two-component system sensor histidine kinase KdpD
VPLVYVDPVLLGQVLLNLLENAVKYAPAGSPIEIAASHDGVAVELTVSDRGPGVPAELARGVFDKFVRGGESAVSGVGLGLAICRGIVEAHGGAIDVVAREGGGARFRVRLLLEGTPPS